MAQRIKAVEKSMVDNNQWHRAQFCELIEAESATLLGKEEDYTMDKEWQFQRRLQRKDPWDQTSAPQWSKDSWKGKDKGKGKGKKGHK